MRKIDVNFRLKVNIRDRIYKALKFQKNFKTFDLVGCTLDQLKKHLELQFQPGMTWDNYGEWHIDHKFPLSMVELSDKDALLKVCNYQNLQPMWAKDNYRKNNRINDIIKKDFESIVL